MSLSGGTYTLYATGNPVVTGTTISSSWANNTLNDIATALSTCLLKDGTQTATASVPFAAGMTSTTGTFSGIVSVDDVTDTTSGTTGSIHTDGGIGIAKALYVGTTSTFVGVATHSANIDLNAADILMDDGRGILDDSSNEYLRFQKTATAVNQFDITNAAVNTNPQLSATGGDTNIGLDFQAKGTGVYRLLGTADTAAELRLLEDTDNGTNYTGLKAAAAIAANATFTLPSADGVAGNVLKTNGSATLSFGNPVTLGTEQASTSGVAIDFTGIPAGTKRIDILLV